MTARVAALSGAGGPVAGDRTVVVFPHAGGSPRFFIPWRRELPAGVDLYGVTYPGRHTLLDQPAPENLVDLASGCATELAPIIRSSDSVVLFGHSMGAYVAFETVRSLQRMGISVAALVVSGAEAPHLVVEQAWHGASDDELVRHIGELDVRTREVLAVPELRRMFLPTIRDDYRLVETYRSEPNRQLSCPIYAMYGESDPEVNESNSAAWGAYTRADTRVRGFPGDHFYLSAQLAEVVAYLCAVSGLVSGCVGDSVGGGEHRRGSPPR